MALPKRNGGGHSGQRLWLVVVFLLGLGGTAAAFVVAARGAEPAPAHAPSGMVPGHYARQCLPGAGRACYRTYVPPRFRPSLPEGQPRQGPPARRPDLQPDPSDAGRPGPDISTRSYGSGYFDLPRRDAP